MYNRPSEFSTVHYNIDASILILVTSIYFLPEGPELVQYTLYSVGQNI